MPRPATELAAEKVNSWCYESYLTFVSAASWFTEVMSPFGPTYELEQNQLEPETELQIVDGGFAP
jgi:hypothetical protein